MNIKKIQRFLKTNIIILIAIQAILFLIFGLPILGLYSALEVASYAGCEISAVGPQECYLYGIEIGERLYGYAIPMVGAPLTPIAFWYAFNDLLIPINVVCFIFGVIYLTNINDEKRKQRANK